MSTEEDGMVEDRNQEDCFVNDDVDNLVHNLSEEWLKEQEIARASHASPQKPNSLIQTVPTEADVKKGSSAAAVSFMEPKPSEDVSEHQVACNISLCENCKVPNFKSHSLKGVNKKVQRTSSCPPGRVHSLSAGPWSLEWAKRHKEVVNGVAPLLDHIGNHITTSRNHRSKRRKGDGQLRHCAVKLKRIARLSDEDRKEVLRALRKTFRRRKVVSEFSIDKVISNDSSSVNGSQISVNNDRTNWLALHGDSKTLSDDVRGLGKAVGLDFQGDMNNRFDVLARVGRKNKEGVGKGK